MVRYNNVYRYYIHCNIQVNNKECMTSYHLETMLCQSHSNNERTLLGYILQDIDYTVQSWGLERNWFVHVRYTHKPIK